MMKKIEVGTVGFWLLTVFLVLVSAFCITGTVMSRSNPGEQELESYFRAKEQQLLRDTRAYLGENGYSNSGVTITRVVDENGAREYTITVHHGKIDKMDEKSKENLKEELSTLVFAEENCTFYHEFLVTD